VRATRAAIDVTMGGLASVAGRERCGATLHRAAIDVMTAGPKTVAPALRTIDAMRTVAVMLMVVVTILIGAKMTAAVTIPIAAMLMSVVIPRPDASSQPSVL
jgi:hypothetical protein